MDIIQAIIDTLRGDGSGDRVTVCYGECDGCTEDCQLAGTHVSEAVIGYQQPDQSGDGPRLAVRGRGSI